MPSLRPLAAIAILLPCVALAAGAEIPEVNDTSYGGRGADPVPLQPTAVQLRAADVHLEHVLEKDAWQVSATYDLFNPGAAPAALQLLLPEDLCVPPRGCSPMAGAYLDVGVRFGDEVLTAATAKPEMVRPWAEHPGQGYLYSISVPPQEPARFSIEYRFDASHGSRWWGVRWRSAAGRWGGPPGRVRYTVEMHQPTPYVLYPRACHLAEFAERDHGGAATIRLVFTAEGAAARDDFWAIFPADAQSGLSPAGFCQGFRGDLSDDELRPILAGYDRARLRACREQVLALHGARRLPAPVLPAWAEKRGLALAPRPMNPAFREAGLGPGEQAYLRALSAAERQVKK